MTRRPLSVALVVLVLLGGCSPAETPETPETAPDVHDMELEPLQQRAEQGHADAQSRLGYMYDTGEGVPQDDVEAVKWYRLAADQGHDAAQYLLGVMYNSGRGVPQDYTQAFIWYRLAAAQGYAAAQYNLGVLYDTGQGVPQDDQFDADVAYSMSRVWWVGPLRGSAGRRQFRYAVGLIAGRTLISAWLARRSHA